ncbi:MAG: aminotransferase class III-fold pyridoxal phosphate-dependent enzyme [Rhodospirillaceae bacterium]
MTYTAGYSPTGLIREALSKKSDRALSALETRTGHSWKMALDRAQILPESKDLPAALNLFIRTASGARVTDLDGNAFIDLSMGYGAQILGHNHPLARDAVLAQAERGWDFGLPGADQLELARLIQTAGPANERVLLCDSGEDAFKVALLAAQRFTGSADVAVFASGMAAEPVGGRPPLPYGEASAFDLIRAQKDGLAAIVVEPVRAVDPTLVHGAWLQELMTVARAAGVLVIFDETYTGFRLAFGGAQELLGLMPDLTIYGRAVGGGLPLGAVAGRADVMATCGEAVVEFSGNPISIAAGVAILRDLLARRAEIYPKLNEAGRKLADDFNGVSAAERLPVAMNAVGSMFRIMFQDTVAEAAFYLFALSRSIFINTSRMGFLSAAHRAAELDYVASALAESLRDVRDDGLFTPALAGRMGRAAHLGSRPLRRGDIRPGEMS